MNPSSGCNISRIREEGGFQGTPTAVFYKWLISNRHSIVKKKTVGCDALLHLFNRLKITEFITK